MITHFGNRDGWWWRSWLLAQVLHDFSLLTFTSACLVPRVTLSKLNNRFEVQIEDDVPVAAPRGAPKFGVRAPLAQQEAGSRASLDQ